jgi:hypothetical protein
LAAQRREDLEPSEQVGLGGGDIEGGLVDAHGRRAQVPSDPGVEVARPVHAHARHRPDLASVGDRHMHEIVVLMPGQGGLAGQRRWPARQHRNPAPLP